MSRFNTALSEGFTSTVAGLPVRGMVQEAPRGSGEVDRQGGHRGLGGLVREKFKLPEILAQEGLDAADVDAIEGARAGRRSQGDNAPHFSPSRRSF